jgi:ABC-type phosphate transport system substrate-binding protein
MDMSLQKRTLSGLLSLLVGLGMAWAVFAADASAELGGPPAKGNICREDGGIDGRGSTYQNHLQQETFKKAEETDCGHGVPLLEYNYTNAVEKSLTGSGAGLKAISCRTDDFAGTDLPYSNAQLGEIDGPVGELEGTKAAGGCEPAGFAPPYLPSSPWPATLDKEAKLMSFPIGGSSVAIAVNLVPADCKKNAAPTELKFSGKEVSRLFGGEVETWEDPEIVANNPELKTDECDGKVTRVVREDNSGTTNILKGYLERLELNFEKSTVGPRTGFECAPAHTWASYNTSPNTKWPEASEGGVCKGGAYIHAEKSGGPELIKTVEATANSVGYADLADAVGHGLILAKVENAQSNGKGEVGAVYEAPVAGTLANCKYSEDLTLPEGGSAEGAVGLGAHENYSNTPAANSPENHVFASLKGTKYPICGLTFDLVYEGEGRDETTAIEEGTAFGTAIKPDQRQTLYWYFEDIVFNPIVQSHVVDYAPLPLAFLTKVATGFNEFFTK